MKRQAAVGKRTRSKSKQTSLHDFDTSSSSTTASSSNNNVRSSRSTATSKRAVEKLRRAAYSSLSADYLPKRGGKSSSDEAKKQQPARRRRSGGANAKSIVVAGSSISDDGTPHPEMTQSSSSSSSSSAAAEANNAISKREKTTTCSNKIEATKSSKRVKTEPQDVKPKSNDNNDSNSCKVNHKSSGDVAQDDHNNNNNINTINYKGAYNDESDQESESNEELEVTPAAKTTQLRQVTIEPQLTLTNLRHHRQQQQQQIQDSSRIITPHFHTSWKTPYTTENSPLPPGVIDIDTFHHQCCHHSLISHCGYSWVTSQRRCHCEMDANHNTVECYSQAYLGSYGQERCASKLANEWKVEQWLLDRVGRERAAQVHSIRRGLELKWNNFNPPPIIPTKVQDHLDYMGRQPHINTDMRSILMDWLVELAEEYKLSSETLFLSSMLVDRSLAMNYGVEGYYRGGEMIVQKDQLQCVGW